MADDSSANTCPFCRSNNLLKSNVLAESDSAYLINNAFFPGNYLITPSTHVGSPLELPDTWWQDVKELLAQVPGPLTDYNLSFNIGKQAGQTIKHLHLWVIPRAADEPASSKGLVTLINFRNEHEL
jgi:diadenosine tetraphosphate (Ap4A) HIT family hydrolase